MDRGITPRARASDAPTSHQAAENARAFARDHYALILGVLWRPMTIYRIATLTGLTHVQVARRMPELQQRGEARPTGETAPGESGAQCRLWELV
jgi:CRP-like cAMP-binding protein